jgi:hypothetical protein
MRIIFHYQCWRKQHFSWNPTLVDTKEQLWQRMRDAANEIRTTPGVFRVPFRYMCSCPWRAFRAFTVTCVTSKLSLSQAFRISDMLGHFTTERLSPVTFYRSIYRPVFIGTS